MPYLVGCVLVLIVIVAIIWGIVALLATIFSWLMALVVSIGTALAVGLSWLLAICALLGIVALPVGCFTALLSAAQVLKERPRGGWPDEIHAGAFRRPAPGPNSDQWDYAWPNVLPYHFRHDLRVVRRRAKDIITNVGVVPLGFPMIIIESLPLWLGIPVGVLVGLCLLAPIFGFALGALAGFVLWLALALVTTAVGTLLIRAAALMLRAHQARRLTRAGAALHCLHCYRVSARPNYRCPGCGTTHCDVRPGELGVTTRICGCGERFILGVSSLAKNLVPTCPYCDTDQPMGSGAHGVITVPVFGMMGAGKTQLLSALITGLALRADRSGADLEPLTPAAADFLSVSKNLFASGKSPLKTPSRNQPEALPYRWTSGGTLDVQLLDAAGERFQDMDTSHSLAYLDTSPTLLYLLDPLTLPALGADPEETAQGSWADAYGSVVDRLRTQGIDLNRKRLIIVVSKADLALQRMLPHTLPLEGSPLREWLAAAGGDALIRRAESDFADIRLVAVDSHTSITHANPWEATRVVDHLIDRRGRTTVLSTEIARSQT